MRLRAWTDRLLSLLLAPPCALCGEVLERPLQGAVCARCWDALQVQPAAFSLASITAARAVGTYDATLRDLIHALKYAGRRSIAPRLSALMALHGAEVLRGADCVTPVPLHPRRLRQRGFNQAHDLARGLGLPVDGALVRVRSTRPQIELPAEERRHNVRHAFALRWAVPAAPSRARPRLHGRVVVLIDDVTTTGATLEACARVLKNAGAKEIRALTAARVVTARPQTPRG